MKIKSKLYKKNETLDFFLNEKILFFGFKEAKKVTPWVRKWCRGGSWSKSDQACGWRWKNRLGLFSSLAPKSSLRPKLAGET